MTEQERIERGCSWLAWYMGEFSQGSDYADAGAKLLVLYCELGRQCLSFEQAQVNLRQCWGSGKLPVPAPKALILDCWQDGLQHPMDTLVTLTACVGALYILCVEGRAGRDRSLDIAERWAAAAHPELLIAVTAPGGQA